MVKRALISVSDKTGAVEFARGLAALGVEIISTGGTAKALNGAGVRTIEVQDITGFPECLDGRVKTLHPKIHGGLLAVRTNERHMDIMREYGVDMIDLVAINLCPFKDTVSKPGATLEEAIEQIDIGGPAMLRSAAKNYMGVSVIVDTADYRPVLEALEQSGEVPADMRYRLAVKAFEHTASYDALISQYLAGQLDGLYFPEKLTLTFEKKQQMRYGENPHQAAAFYADPIPAPGSLATYTQLHGKELSYNNIGDLDGALSLLAEFSGPAAVAVKHANPCGVATAGSIFDAYMKAYESDTVSIFGGIIALNRSVDAPTAAEINKIFIEIVVAPGYDGDALKILKKKKNIRLLTLDMQGASECVGAAGAPAGVADGQAPGTASNPGAIADGQTPGTASPKQGAPAGVADGQAPGTAAPKQGAPAGVAPMYIKKVGGGMLIQTNDSSIVDEDMLKVVTKVAPTEKELSDLIFAMTVVKHTKSNAIVLAKDNATVGVGPGQNSRIMSTKIAIEVAGERAKGSVAASEALFPLSDCVEALAAAGVTAVIQPGGSIRDADSIEACDRLGLSMVFTGIRHFRH